PTAIDFGRVAVNNSATQTVTVQNFANYPEPLAVSDLTGDAVLHFKKTTAPAELPPGTPDNPGVVTIDVTFTPNLASPGGPFQTGFTITPCGGCDPVTIPVKGVGVDTGVDVTPNPIDFGFVNPNTTKKLAVTIRNASPNAFDVKSIDLNPTGQDDL